MFGPEHPVFTCPACGKASWNRNDALYGWCGACHDYTAPPVVLPSQLERLIQENSDGSSPEA